MASDLSRRSLLTGLTGLAGLAALGTLEACSGSKKGQGTTSTTVFKLGDAPDLQIGLASFDTIPGSNQRVAFGLLDKDAQPITRQGVTFRIGPDETKLGSPIPTTLVTPTGGRPFYTGRADLPAAGNYVLVVSDGKLTAQAPFQVLDPSASLTPRPTQPAISVPTPTTADPLDAKQLCTHDPVCPLHDVSLDKALTGGKPLAVLFATPAFCSSEFCGPMLDVLLGQHATFADRVQFVHVEIYKDGFVDINQRRILDSVSSWHLEGEPYLFLVDAKGIVAERIDGPFADSEAAAALGRLVGS